MNNEELEQFLAWCRYLANNKEADRIVANHARGILVRIATAASEYERVSRGD
jgi:hypothetical protein